MKYSVFFFFLSCLHLLFPKNNSVLQKVLDFCSWNKIHVAALWECASVGKGTVKYLTQTNKQTHTHTQFEKKRRNVFSFNTYFLVCLYFVYPHFETKQKVYFQSVMVVLYFMLVWYNRFQINESFPFPIRYRLNSNKFHFDLVLPAYEKFNWKLFVQMLCNSIKCYTGILYVYWKV